MYSTEKRWAHSGCCMLANGVIKHVHFDIHSSPCQTNTNIGFGYSWSQSCDHRPSRGYMTTCTTNQHCDFMSNMMGHTHTFTAHKSIKQSNPSCSAYWYDHSLDLRTQVIPKVLLNHYLGMTTPWISELRLFLSC